jgi:hypothetical protein
VERDTYEINAGWFEDIAVKVMDKTKYSRVKDVLRLPDQTKSGVTDIGALNTSVLSLAQEAKCHKFMGHSNLQRTLDDMFHSDQHGKIEPSMRFLSIRILLAILLPFLMIPRIYKLEDPVAAKNERESNYKYYHYFYRLPIVKFWTNTLFYGAFLFVQAYVLCTWHPEPHYHAAESILWIWVLGLVIDEVYQAIQNRRYHFKYLSNKMDAILLVLHIFYIVSRIFAILTDSSALYSIAVNTLIVACVFSWARLLTAFALNDTLVPATYSSKF